MSSTPPLPLLPPPQQSVVTRNEDWKSKKLFDNEDEMVVGVFSFECFTGPFCNKEDTVAAQHLLHVMESSADAFINGGKKGKHIFAISKMELQYIAGGIHCVSPVLPCAKDNILSNSRVAKGFANLKLLNPGDEKARYHIRGLGQPAAGEFKKSLQQKIKTMKHFTGDDESLMATRSVSVSNGGKLGPFLNSLPVNSNSKEFLSGFHNWGWTPVAAALDEVANEVVVEVVVKGVNDSFEKS
jgi:hypothetical protein